jgi:hypothetical protein
MAKRKRRPVSDRLNPTASSGDARRTGPGRLGGRDAPLVSAIPREGALRALYAERPGYRLLVTYLTYFPLEAHINFGTLSASDQEAIRAVQRDTPPPAPPRRWEPDPERPVDREDLRDAAGHVPRVFPYEKTGRRPGGPKAFTLALAWWLMENDNRQAARDPHVAKLLARLAKQRHCTPDMLLSLSYVPREVAGLLYLRASARTERQLQSRAVRRLRQIEARDLAVPPDLAGLAPESRKQEIARWKTLGLDKESGSLSRQALWTDIFRGLMNEFGAMELSKSGREAARDASRLVHVRYPNLWSDRPELVRKRYFASST